MNTVLHSKTVDSLYLKMDENFECWLGVAEDSVIEWHSIPRETMYNLETTESLNFKDCEGW